MKRWVAGALTVALMSGLLWEGVRRPLAVKATGAADGPAGAAGTDATGSSPAEARVLGLIASAASGDVPAYLDAFSGALRQRLGREIGERGIDAFADDLRAAARARKGHAVFAAEFEGDDAARVTVETVYPDRNERQTYLVERRGGTWLVADVETVRSHQPGAKFGTPAGYVAPEGVPVQGAVRVETGDGPEPPAGGDPAATPRS